MPARCWNSRHILVDAVMEGPGGPERDIPPRSGRFPGAGPVSAATRVMSAMLRRHRSRPAVEKNPLSGVCKEDKETDLKAPRWLKPQASSPQGERPAFEELLARHLDTLYRVALRCRAQDPQAAEDLVQEAVLRGWRNYATLREPAAARVWLIRILIRTHQNQCRAEARGGVLALEDLEDGALERLLADWRPGPAALAELAETRTRLAAALAALPAAWSLIIQLVDIEGLHLREAAAALELPPGTVASRRFRALLRLRAALNDQEVAHGQDTGN